MTNCNLRETRPYFELIFPCLVGSLRIVLESDIGRGGAYAHRILLVVQQGDQLLPELWEGMHRHQVGGRSAH